MIAKLVSPRGFLFLIAFCGVELLDELIYGLQWAMWLLALGLIALVIGGPKNGTQMSVDKSKIVTGGFNEHLHFG